MGMTNTEWDERQSRYDKKHGIVRKKQFADMTQNEQKIAVVEAIPYYPNEITITEIALKVGANPASLICTINAMASNPEICEDDDGRLSRLKDSQMWWREENGVRDIMNDFIKRDTCF